MIVDGRRQVLDAALARHPHRFGTTTPKILDLPDTVYINRPADDPEATVGAVTTAASHPPGLKPLATFR